MKNIHVLKTDKPSRLSKDENDRIWLSINFEYGINDNNKQNIYITSDEEIKEGDCFLEKAGRQFPIKWDGKEKLNFHCKKIILTTDGDLIKEGVQSIDDNFLEWFVKNPSCEEAKVEITEISCIIPNFGDVDKYRIAIPKQESKTAWVGVLHDKLNEYHPAEYELKDIYQGEGCLPNFPDEELCQIWCDSQYKEVPKQETTADYIDRHIVEAMVEVAKQKMYSEEEVINIIYKIYDEMGISISLEDVVKQFKK
jgi:hypothetical protein